MKKKIFITGGVREYETENTADFCKGIEDYIKANLVTIDNADNITVSTFENTSDDLTIIFNFGTGKSIKKGMISREMYRCFTGEGANFNAHHSIYWPMSFGPSFPMNVFFPIDDTIISHKKNTKFYRADRYKNISINETPYNLTINIKF